MRDSVLPNTNIRCCHESSRAGRKFPLFNFPEQAKTTSEHIRGSSILAVSKADGVGNVEYSVADHSKRNLLDTPRDEGFCNRDGGSTSGHENPRHMDPQCKSRQQLSIAIPYRGPQTVGLQILHLNQSLLNDESPALNATRFHNATKESEWFTILASALSGLEKLYIVVDAEIMNRELASQIS
jgi:hypothetical protein